MSDEKQCPSKAGQRVTVCSGERCAWWDDDGTVYGRGDSGCALLSISRSLWKIASCVVPKLPEEPR